MFSMSPDADKVTQEAADKAAKEAADKATQEAAKLLPNPQQVALDKATRLPANWQIEATDNPDIIQAHNNATGADFTGTRKQLSAILRGE